MCTLLYFEVMKNWTQVPNYLHYVFNNVFSVTLQSLINNYLKTLNMTFTSISKFLN